jgi:DNA primase
MLPMGFRAPVNTWQMTARGNRLDWSDVKDRVGLAAVATNLLGPAPGRRAGQGRLWWKCPFHDDKNPSFHVNPIKQSWKCYGCSEHGDAAALVMKLKHCTFPEAVAHLAGKPAPSGKPAHPRPPAASPPVKPAAGPVKQSSGLPLADALKLVEEAAARLWTPEGGDALAYLRGRGLSEGTIKAARLGWTPRVSIPVKDGTRFWDVSGIVIPWMDRDRLAMVKIRRPSGSEPKYAEAFRDRPAIFPASEAVRPGMPLVVVEGEFDCLLLAQELADLAAVVTLGSASARPEGSTYVAMLPAPTWYLAHDADEAGDKAASAWPARARRVRPQKGKDWTDARQAGIELRRWWIENEFTEVFDREERAAVMEFDGGLSREAAERAACLIHSLRPRGMAESSN